MSNKNELIKTMGEIVDRIFDKAIEETFNECFKIGLKKTDMSLIIAEFSLHLAVNSVANYYNVIKDKDFIMEFLSDYCDKLKKETEHAIDNGMKDCTKTSMNLEVLLNEAIGSRH